MNVLDLIVKEISADAILQNAESINGFSRTSSFDNYNDSAMIVLRALEDYGVQCEKIDIPADGISAYGDAVMPFGWTCSDAKLEMISPTSETLFTYQESPYCVGMWSPPTSPEGVEAKLISLEKGEPYELDAQDAQGKFVLTPGPAEAIRQAAAQKGVAAVISYYLPNPEGENEVHWIGSNTNTPGGWGSKHEEEHVILLSLSPKAGRDLARLSQNHDITLRLTLQSEITQAALPLISATIPGQNEDEEVWMHTPLYEPGANFSAVTVACMMEIIRIMHGQVSQGKFNQPLRTLRFLFTPKLYGMLFLAASKPEWCEKALYSLCLEGGAGNPDISWCRWAYRTPPAFLRHYSDGLAWQIFNQYLQEYRPQRFLESRSYSLAADTLLNDPAIGIPTHWLYGGTDKECRHNSFDTMETIDRRSCIDYSAACCTMMLSMANVSRNDVPDLAYWNYQLALERLNDDVQIYRNRAKELKTVESMSDLLGEAHVNLPLRVELEKGVLQSLSTLTNGDRNVPEWSTITELEAMLKDLCDSGLTLIKQHLIQRCEQMKLRAMSLEVPPAPAGDERVFKRAGNAKGTITLDSLPLEEWASPVKESPRRNLPFILSWWLCDGERTVGEIERLVSMELFRYRECIPAWFNFLEANHYIEFVQGGDAEEETYENKNLEQPEAEQIEQETTEESAKVMENSKQVAETGEEVTQAEATEEESTEKQHRESRS